MIWLGEVSRRSAGRTHWTPLQRRRHAILQVTVLCATGILIWWPGVTRWWRSLILRRRVGWARFNWDLHSAVGFWMFAFVLMWGISGIYLAFPEPFTDVVDYLQPLDANSVETRTGDEVLAWLARIHFGRAYGTSVKWLWTLLGFVPVILFLTGAHHVVELRAETGDA